MRVGGSVWLLLEGHHRSVEEAGKLLGQKEVEKRIWCLADLLKSTFDPVKFKEEMREKRFFLQQAELPFLHL